MFPGLLLSFEGIDGCGKTTQAHLLDKKLNDLAMQPLLVREPGGTSVGEHLRALLLDPASALSMETEVLLFVAARTELVRVVVAPALAVGRPVLCDRFSDSTLAYQGYGYGADLNWIGMLNRRAARGLQPRLTFLLDLPVEAAAARRHGSGTGDRVESRDLSFHRRVRQGYRELAGKEPGRFVLLDASLNQIALHEVIWQQVSPLLPCTGVGRR